MISRSYLTESPKDNPHGVDVRQLYNQASAQVMHILLQAGESLKPHVTPVDVTFYILEGQVSVRIGEEWQSFEKDTLIESPANVVHSLSNKSDAVARILVTKAPRPSQPTRIL